MTITPPAYSLTWMVRLILSLLCLHGITSAKSPAQPNILLIVSDDAGYSDFGFQGCKDIPTPHLDKLAREGLRFTQGYVPGCVCSPSRAGMLTGKNPSRIGHEDNLSDRSLGVDANTELLPARLRKLGYHTAGLGKWHLGWADQYQPWNRGFDEFYGFLGGGSEYLPKNNQPIPMLRNGKPTTESEYLTTALGREAVNLITHPSDHPWFLYLAFNAVHSPMQSSPNSETALTHIPNKKRRTLAAMTIALDDAVGRVLAALDASGQRDHTLVVFINDNGGATYSDFHNAPLRGHKGTLFEGGIRVPFLIRWPAMLPAGKTYDSPVCGLDLLPTFLAAAGGENSLWQDSDGTNLLPFLTGKQSARPHQQLFWRFNVVASVRDGDWKLIRIKDHDPLLFDLANDPAENHNMAASQPEKTKSLLDAIANWEKNFPPQRWHEDDYWIKIHYQDHLKAPVYLGQN